MAHSDVKWRIVLVVPLRVNTSSLFRRAGQTNQDNTQVTDEERQTFSKQKPDTQILFLLLLLAD